VESAWILDDFNGFSDETAKYAPKQINSYGRRSELGLFPDRVLNAREKWLLL
jgi:hypothetical protein